MRAGSSMSSAVATMFSRMDQPPLQYLVLSGDNGGSQPVLGVSTQIAKGMV